MFPLVQSKYCDCMDGLYGAAPSYASIQFCNHYLIYTSVLILRNISCESVPYEDSVLEIGEIISIYFKKYNMSAEYIIQDCNDIKKGRYKVVEK